MPSKAKKATGPLSTLPQATASPEEPEKAVQAAVAVTPKPKRKRKRKSKAKKRTAAAVKPVPTKRPAKEQTAGTPEATATPEKPKRIRKPKPPKVGHSSKMGRPAVFLDGFKQVSFQIEPEAYTKIDRCRGTRSKADFLRHIINMALRLFPDE